MGQTLDLTERLATIVHTQEEIASMHLDLDAVRRLVAGKVQEILAADGAVVETVREDEIHYHTAVGSLAPHTGTLFDLEGSLSGLCVRTRQAQKCNDAEIDERVNREVSAAAGTRSIIVVPLVHEDLVRGILKVVSMTPERFSDLDVYSLQLMAGLIAAAMAHAPEYEATAASEERFRLLFERNIAGAFRSTREGRLLDANDALATLLGYDSRDELRSHQTWDFYPARDDRERLLEALQRDGLITRYRIRFKRKDGSFLDALTNMDLVTGDHETWLLGTIIEAFED